MLLTITNESPDATDLGFLLHKNPAAVRSLDLAFGTGHVFYPEATPDRCTAALLVEVDPVALVRRSRGGPFPLAPYVNDRPYAASSFLSVALRKTFGTALRGQCRERPELPAQALDLSAAVPVLPCHGGEDLLRRLFEPLGYEVAATPIALDDQTPAWGDSPYYDVRISARCRVRDLLGHLYVLLPVLDDAKHYWVSRDEIGKLADGAGEWLAAHPEREVIVRRYLRHQRALVAEAIARLLDDGAAGTQAALLADADNGDEALPPPPAGQGAGPGGAGAAGGEPAETPAGRGRAGSVPGSAGLADPGAVPSQHVLLRDLRVAAVVDALTGLGARRVLDLGCGDGRLLDALLRDSRFEEIVGVDAAVSALERAARRLRLEQMAPRQRERVRLLHSALTYADRRLAGYHAAVLAEVIEHVDPARLEALEQAVFGEARPGAVVVTTPNVEYNVRYQGLAAGDRRHPDHRFEWDRATFMDWAERVARRYGYGVRFQPVGDPDPDVGPPTQMAVFERAAASERPAASEGVAEAERGDRPQGPGAGPR